MTACAWKRKFFATSYNFKENGMKPPMAGMNAVERRRREKYLTQAQVGQAAGVSGVVVHKIESGRPIKRTSIERIAEVLGLSRRTVRDCIER